MPQLLCREASRSGRAGVGQVAKRFRCIQDRDFGSLISLLVQDKELASKREAQRQERVSPPDPSNKTRNAVSLISKGFISKAVNRMTSHGVVSMTDPIAQAALKAKYPPRSVPMPTQVLKGQAVERMLSLREPFLNAKPGTAPGTGQLRPEYLTALAEEWVEGEP